MNKGTVYEFTNRTLKRQNDDVIVTIRKTGLFPTNEQVVDAALRLLVMKLKDEYDMLPKPETAKVPEQEESLPVLPTLLGDEK